jgi:hypothetical protein
MAGASLGESLLMVGLWTDFPMHRHGQVPGLPRRPASLAEGRVKNQANNRELRDHLVSVGIAHDYLELTGVGHTALPTLAGGANQWEFYRDVLSAVAAVTSP